MRSIINHSYSLEIQPDTDATGTDTFGLSAGMVGSILAEGDHQFFTRTFYPAYVDNDAGGSAADDSFTLGDFPGFANQAPGGVAQLDWRGEAFAMASLKAVVVEVKLKEAFEVTSAAGTITSTGVNVTDADTLTIGTTVYRFKNTMAAAYDVKIGATAAITITNLKAAINETGTPGTEYYAGTVVHPDVAASDETATTLEITALRPGTLGNAIATTDTAATLSFGAATLTGGGESQSPPVARELEGTVQIRLENDILPGTSDLDFTVSSPCLFTLTVPEGWTPGATGLLTIVFTSPEPAPLGPTDVNAVVTVTLVGNAA